MWEFLFCFEMSDIRITDNEVVGAQFKSARVREPRARDENDDGDEEEAEEGEGKKK